MSRLFLAASFLFITAFHPYMSSASERLMIAASFYPLAYFAEQVGGDHVDVANITPEGVDPHEYEPTARDMIRIWNARIFLFSGAGIDPWSERIRDDLQKKGIISLRMTDHFALLGGGEDPSDDNGRYDPHIWLDPLLALKEVELIRDLCISTDPDNESMYRKNAAAYSDILRTLHQRYSDELRNCETRHLIVSHDAFRYIAERYNLQIHPIAGLSPEEEPTPRKMAETIRFARDNNIEYIFTETLVSPKIAETIAREVGATILIFNPISGLTVNEVQAGTTYLSLMNENLQNIKLALSCD